MNESLYQWCVDIYVSIASQAVPIALVFGVCNIIVSTFLGAVLGGRVRFGAGGAGK